LNVAKFPKLKPVPIKQTLETKMTSSNENGWAEYSKLVLKELETLADGIQKLQVQLIDLKQEVAELRAKEDRVQQLVQWKDRVDEIASPTQLQTLKDDVESLKLFKTKAVTIFMVVQFAMGVALALLKMV
tara:strand:- start:240 stop:629 length:390 start_codon:yes stop_codon:yes gene_type:complete